MTSPMAFNRDEMIELLAGQVEGTLTHDEERTLSSALHEDPTLEADRLELELVAAALMVASVEQERAPQDLISRLHQFAPKAEQREPTPELKLTGDGPAQRHDTRAPGAFGWIGWVAAAACLLIAAMVWFGRTSAPPPPLDEQRAQLLATAPDAVTLEFGDWALGGDGPEIQGVEGDVVWSESEQCGYLRFKNLPANDPSVEQYQLWIVDKRGLFDEHDQSARISGAIFNGSDGEVIVPIEPGIPVQGAGAFAVTIEEPGGVWASTMARRVVIAARPG